MLYSPSGSMVALVTPFTADDKVDIPGFETLIDRQIRYGTNSLFVLGSCGETNLLSLDERKLIVREVVQIVNKRVPVFFNATAMKTADAVSFAQYIEKMGGDGVIIASPPYLLLPQTALADYLSEVFGSISISCGIYNNPARNGVNIRPETIAALSQKHPNFVVDKEAMGNAQQILQVKRLCGDRIKTLVCDFPKYSILLPNLGMGGDGSANVGGNIIPEETALYSRPWDSMEKVYESRSLYCKYYPLLEALYWFTNPVVVKAALRILGLPGGPLRKPHQEVVGERFELLRKIMEDLGVIEKYGV